MEGQAFREALERVQASAIPSSGNNLLGMEIDFFTYLERPTELDDTSLTVRRTGEPHALIVATCSARPGIDLTTAADAVRKVWEQELRSEYFAASVTRLLDDRAEVACLTQINENDFYVTASITVWPARH